jgi:hypothetical protein
MFDIQGPGYARGERLDLDRAMRLPGQRNQTAPAGAPSLRSHPGSTRVMSTDVITTRAARLPPAGLRAVCSVP